MSEQPVLNQEAMKKLRQAIVEGVRVQQEIDDLKGGLKEVVKEVANEVGVEPKVINQAIRAKYKNDLAEKKETLDAVEEIVHLIK